MFLRVFATESRICLQQLLSSEWKRWRCMLYPRLSNSNPSILKRLGPSSSRLHGQLRSVCTLKLDLGMNISWFSSFVRLRADSKFFTGPFHPITITERYFNRRRIVRKSSQSWTSSKVYFRISGKSSQWTSILSIIGSSFVNILRCMAGSYCIKIDLCFVTTRT